MVKLLEEVADLRRAVAALLDRTNCKLIAAHPYTRVNWASGIDLAS
jgi:hypothetical protein